ncbi:uncharacterized protein LOC134266858 [Saccostrea cucullata]|uniref:uncharacterized protein LOC134266858 n=1 Tax=Saccostrea cuccullata TaxID=36930 RepID=UPI002ED14B88
MTYSGPLKNAVNRLSQEVLGKDMFQDYKPPGKYTGELIGIEYLYSQTGEGVADYTSTARQLLEGPDTEDMEMYRDPEADEGFEELDDVTDPTTDILDLGPDFTRVEHETQDSTHSPTPQTILHIPSDTEYRQLMVQKDEGTCMSKLL